jgi:hypothetical protein
MSGHKQLHGKHWVPHHQHSEVPDEQKIELVSIPSTSTYALNGQVFQIDFKEKGLTIMDMGLEIETAGGISGLTGTVSGYPNLNPASFWNTRIDVMIGGQVIFSNFNVSQFIRKQLFQSDEGRLMSNSG